jgi:hypothetical protein
MEVTTPQIFIAHADQYEQCRLSPGGGPVQDSRDDELPVRPRRRRHKYVTTLVNTYAIDARTGQQRWVRHEPTRSIESVIFGIAPWHDAGFWKAVAGSYAQVGAVPAMMEACGKAPGAAVQRREPSVDGGWTAH